jgi:hypothetical protein
MAKMKVTDNGKPVKELGDMIGDVLAVTIWTAIGSVLSIFAGLFFVHHYAPLKGQNKTVGYLLPFIGVGLFYGALALQAKVLK